MLLTVVMIRLHLQEHAGSHQQLFLQLQWPHAIQLADLCIFDVAHSAATVLA